MGNITIVLRHVFLTIAIALSKYSVQLVGKEGWYSGIKLGRGAGDNSNDSNKIFDTKENVSFMNSNIHCSFVRNSHVFLCVHIIIILRYNGFSIDRENILIIYYIYVLLLHINI